MENLQISDERLDIAVKAAERAGNAARSVKHTTTQERKANDTIVTEADREAETIVREILTEESGLPILGEEHGGEVGEADSYWVVDPIDGTNNFSYEQPIYGSAVALVEENEPVLGVFYMPELDYLFYAVNGEGAYRNDEQLEVTEMEEFGQASVTISGKGREDFYDGLTDVNSWVQILGCAVACESWVASGWSDCAVFGALAPWDMAVGVVLIREAGGVMRTVDGGDEDWESLKEGRVVMGNESIVNRVRSQLPRESVQAILDSTYDY